MLEIALADVSRRLAFDNPWWDDAGPEKVRFANEPRRSYFEYFYGVLSDLKLKRATVLMGPRRAGKTVMVYHAIHRLLSEGVSANRILYLSIETPLYTGLALERLLNLFRELFSHTQDASLFIFFDEIQYLKNWEVHLKSLVDSYPTYRFIATGSAAAALRMKSNESGAGRFSDFVLPPLTFAEYLRFIGKEDALVSRHINESTAKAHYSCNNIAELNCEFINYLNFGGYPEAVFNESIRNDPGQYIKSDIIDKVLLRDLPSLYGISDIQELNRLFTTLAYNTGCEVNLEGLSKASGVAKNTIKRYLEYLEAAFLISRVERIDQNAKRFKRAMFFKVYLNNPSMRAALFGQISADSDGMGAMAETAIFSQWQHSQSSSLFYARWGTGEIDIVYLSPQSQKPDWAIEVKWSDRPYEHPGELANCVHFAHLHEDINQPLLVTSKTIDANLKFQGISFEFKPTSLYTYLLGANILGA
jgi:predicted AAA+ superfamily ATPase